MGKDKDNPNRYGDEAPGFKDFIFVLIAVGILIGFSWIMWFKWGWFH
jgi:hypothetical protein